MRRLTMGTTLPHTLRMKATAKRALEVAVGMGHDYLGTEHMLLAMLDDPDGIAGGVLHRLGFADAVRTELERILTHPGYAT
jgi:ATP-dependent Clp protease ATP-binding subunit ClpA